MQSPSGQGSSKHARNSSFMWNCWTLVTGSESTVTSQMLAYTAAVGFPLNPGPVYTRLWPPSPPGVAIGSIGYPILPPYSQLLLITTQPGCYPLLGLLGTAGLRSTRQPPPGWVGLWVKPRLTVPLPCPRQDRPRWGSLMSDHTAFCSRSMGYRKNLTRARSTSWDSPMYSTCTKTTGYCSTCPWEQAMEATLTTSSPTGSKCEHITEMELPLANIAVRCQLATCTSMNSRQGHRLLEDTCITGSQTVLHSIREHYFLKGSHCLHVKLGLRSTELPDAAGPFPSEWKGAPGVPPLNCFGTWSSLITQCGALQSEEEGSGPTLYAGPLEHELQAYSQGSRGSTPTSHLGSFLGYHFSVVRKYSQRSMASFNQASFQRAIQMQGPWGRICNNCSKLTSFTQP